MCVKIYYHDGNNELEERLSYLYNSFFIFYFQNGLNNFTFSMAHILQDKKLNDGNKYFLTRIVGVA